MLTKITNLEDLNGKTIEDTESNMYGMVFKFKDNTYALFKPTTNEDIIIDSGGDSFYTEVFNILSPTPKIDERAVFRRFNERLDLKAFNLKAKDISDRYPTRTELFAKAIETGETLLSIEEIVNPKFKEGIFNMLMDLKADQSKVSVEGQIEVDLEILYKQCFIISTHLFYYLEG